MYQWSLCLLMGEGFRLKFLLLVKCKFHVCNFSIYTLYYCLRFIFCPQTCWNHLLCQSCDYKIAFPLFTTSYPVWKWISLVITLIWFRRDCITCTWPYPEVRTSCLVVTLIYSLLCGYNCVTMSVRSAEVFFFFLSNVLNDEIHSWCEQHRSVDKRICNALLHSA